MDCHSCRRRPDSFAAAAAAGPCVRMCFRTCYPNGTIVLLKRQEGGGDEVADIDVGDKARKFEQG